MRRSRGRLHGFRWKDHADFKSCAPQQSSSPLDQELGVGDGERATFQLVKSYGTGPTRYVRTIAKPVAGSVRAAVAGIEKAVGTEFTVDATTGIVTFLGASVPGTDEIVTAGFEFDVPVRFESDALAINLSAFQGGEIPDISVVEVRG